MMYAQTEMIVYEDDDLKETMERVCIITQGMDLVSCRPREGGGWTLLFVERGRLR